jgi:hypothetical protein
MHVVCAHPDNGDTAYVDDVLLLKRETDVLMEEQPSMHLPCSTQ